MKRSDAFPGKYTKAADLGGRDHIVTIDRVVREMVGTGDKQQEKTVAYFVGDKLQAHGGQPRQMGTLELIAGSDDSDDWRGLSIVLSARQDALPRQDSRLHHGEAGVEGEEAGAPARSRYRRNRRMKRKRCRSNEQATSRHQIRRWKRPCAHAITAWRTGPALARSARRAANVFIWLTSIAAHHGGVQNIAT